MAAARCIDGDTLYDRAFSLRNCDVLPDDEGYCLALIKKRRNIDARVNDDLINAAVQAEKAPNGVQFYKSVINVVVESLEKEGIVSDAKDLVQSQLDMYNYILKNGKLTFPGTVELSLLEGWAEKHCCRQ